MVELNKEKARYWGYKEHPYDALLDDFMPGMTTAKCDKLFDAVIKPQIIEMITKIKESNENSSKNAMLAHPIQRSQQENCQEYNVCPGLRLWFWDYDQDQEAPSNLRHRVTSYQDQP